MVSLTTKNGTISKSDILKNTETLLVSLSKIEVVNKAVCIMISDIDTYMTVYLAVHKLHGIVFIPRDIKKFHNTIFKHVDLIITKRSNVMLCRFISKFRIPVYSIESILKKTEKKYEYVNEDQDRITSLTLSGGSTGIPKINCRMFRNDKALIEKLPYVPIEEGEMVYCTMLGYGLSLFMRDVSVALFRNIEIDKVAKSSALFLTTHHMYELVKLLMQKNTILKMKYVLFGGTTCGVYFAKLIKKYIDCDSIFIAYGTSETGIFGISPIDVYIEESSKPSLGYFVCNVDDRRLDFIIDDRSVLYLSGSTVCERYLRDEDNEKYKKMIDGKVFHCTGDVVKRIDNKIWIIGRDCPGLENIYVFESDIEKNEGVYKAIISNNMTHVFLFPGFVFHNDELPITSTMKVDRKKIL